VRVSDSTAFVDVRMQRHGIKIRDVSTSSRLLFPPHGQVELAGASATSLNLGDWVAFHIVSDAPQGASIPRVTEYRRLLPLEDLSDLGSSETVRRLLVEEGRAHGVPGEVMVRIGEREMVRLQLARDQDGRWRPIPTDEMRRLPVWRFDPKLCVSIPAEAQNLVLIVDASDRFPQIGTLDWSRDADFVRRIIRSLIRVEAAEDQALRRFAEALGRFADRLQTGASPPQTLDLRIAQEILRIRNLASMLRDQQDLLGTYYEVLRNDPEVRSLLKTRISEIAQQVVDTERKILLEKLTAELERSVAALRSQREAEIRKSAERLGSEMIRELERRRAVGLAELEAGLADRERQGRELLEGTLGGKRAELDAEVTNLEDRRAALLRQVELLGQRERELSASIEALAAKEANVLEKLELFRSQREAEIRRSAEDLSARMTADLEQRIAVRWAEFEAELADRERQGREGLEISLGRKRAELEAAVSRLEDRHVMLDNAIDILERRERELSASVDGLSFKEASALEAMELRRAEREAEIKKSVEALSTGMLADAERRIAARSAELEAELAEREREAHEAVAASLGGKRTAVEFEMSGLENRRISLSREIERLEQRLRELSTSAEGLASREASVLADLEQRRAQREAEIKKSVDDLSAGMIGDLERRLAARTAEFEAGLNDREKQAHEALETSLGARRAELRSDVSGLEARRTALSEEIEQLQQKQRELINSLEDLSSREASAVQNVARLSRRILEEAPSPSRGLRAPPADAPT
jgi:chromosome segregation ATPase